MLERGVVEFVKDQMFRKLPCSIHGMTFLIAMFLLFPFPSSALPSSPKGNTET